MKSRINNRVLQWSGNDARQALLGRRVGLEKEGLRVSLDGHIAQTPHPVALGSALTHPNITTDYSEALLELVTPPFEHILQTLGNLDDIHRYVHDSLKDELLWASSMPCIVSGDASIPIAQYGSSNAGKMKTAYRRGLGHRYGRMMQAIAGVHFNYSYPVDFWRFYQDVLGDQQDFQPFVSESYMGLVRNLQRYGWLIPYLFGCSPAICGSFLRAMPTTLEKLFDYSYFGRYATSLRVSDIGYQNNQEDRAGVHVNYNSLPNYVDSLARAISTPCPGYADFGLCVDGEWQQLNSNILQIENEFYSSVRPKQILNGEEKPTLALSKRGIAYIELRSIDVNVYEPAGISEEQMRFLELFLLLCLLLPSDSYDDSELAEIKYNLNTVAERGRDPDLRLRRGGAEILLRDWSKEIFDQMSFACELLDGEGENSLYCTILERQREKIEEPDKTPSARMLAEMIANREEFAEFSLRLSRQHHEWYRQRPLEEDKQRLYEDMARRSIEDQAATEAADELPFETFLQQYFDQV